MTVEINLNEAYFGGKKKSANPCIAFQQLTFPKNFLEYMPGVSVQNISDHSLKFYRVFGANTIAHSKTTFLKNNYLDPFGQSFQAFVKAVKTWLGTLVSYFRMPGSTSNPIFQLMCNLGGSM